ncbi:MAG: BREX system serine/threonine kinase PglW [Candidatus Eisenbacteria bacterium]|nr:BREX system serine/threonine kinase PglW [Candidatus Eisenbacteria bacterium]
MPIGSAWCIALCPENVLLLDPSAEPVHVQVFNWQVGTRGIGSSVSTEGAVSPTQHIDELMEDTASLYRAPESGRNAESTGEHLDVFSVGAVAYHLFSGEPPATTAFELWERVTRDRGLDLAQVQDGVSNLLRDLVLAATRPAVQDRLDSVDEFLLGLDQFEAELSRPADSLHVHPLSAKPGDMIAHGFRVKRRLGTGSTALALEVERDNEVSVLKVAMNAEHNDRLRAEGEVLAKLRHPRIVPYLETLEIEGHVALRTGRAGEGSLSSRLRDDGQLALDFLERFGRDLLDALAYLEAEGIPHRDLKPDNVGLARQGQSGDLHLVLFDFSLSRARIDDIRAGTEGYLEPFLKLRKPPRWDIAAERWSAAVLLYQMATGVLPRWGDGKSDPAVLDCEATIESSAFDPSVREGLTDFFLRALRRDPRERFDSAEAMGRAWVELFEDAAESRAEQHDLNETRAAAIESANLATQCVELPLSARAQNALQRLAIITVQDLLRTPLIKVFQQRGVGNQTRREIRVWTHELRRRFPDAEVAAPNLPDPDETSSSGETPETPVHLSVDHLLREILPTPGPRSARSTGILRAALGLDVDEWPSQAAAAAVLGTQPAVVNQELSRARNRWRDLPSVTELRRKVHGLVEANGGLAEQGELTAALLMVCGSVQVEPARNRHARAVLRAAVETEGDSVGPRYWQYRHQGRIVIAASQELARYALKLGERADQLAKEDPLPSPARSLALLRAIPAPAGIATLHDARLLRLAVAVSQGAALSSRQEMYPRGMEPARALRLAQGAFYVGGDLSEDDLLRRVHSRYPEARPLPRRPQLDALVAELGLDLAWNPAALGGQGSYQSARRTTASLTSWTDGGGPAPSPVAAEAHSIQELDQRLARARRDGAFLVLLTTPQRHALVHRALVELHQPQAIDLDRLFIEELRAQAVSRRIDWAIVRTTDQLGPNGPDWSKLLTLAKWSVPSFTSRLVAEGQNQTVLATFPGLLARYNQLPVLEEIRDRIGRRTTEPNLQGFWLLLASTQQTQLPQIDGQALPVLAPSQWAWIPSGWGEPARTEV